MPHKYTDAQGNVVLAVSSTIPGLTFIPPGFTPEDATEITPKEFKKMQDHAPKAQPAMSTAQLTSLVQKLQADIEKLTKTKAG